MIKSVQVVKRLGGQYIIFLSSYSLSGYNEANSSRQKFNNTEFGLLRMISKKTYTSNEIIRCWKEIKIKFNRYFTQLLLNVLESKIKEIKDDNNDLGIISAKERFHGSQRI